METNVFQQEWRSLRQNNDEKYVGHVATTCTEFVHGGATRYALTAHIEIMLFDNYYGFVTEQTITPYSALLDCPRYDAQRQAIRQHDNALLVCYQKLDDMNYPTVTTGETDEEPAAVAA